MDIIWEHTVKIDDGVDLEKYLNESGIWGYELVCTEPVIQILTEPVKEVSNSFFVFMKRQKKTEVR